MKSIFLFSTKIRFFISEIPLIALYITAVLNNSAAKGAMKLYPLQIGLLALIAFIMIYFFRAITVSYSEIKHIGRFSPRYKAVINKGKTLIFRLKPHGKMDVILFGNNGEPPLYSNDENDCEPIDIDLFTGHTLGGRRTLNKVLSYFGASASDSESLIGSDFSAELENVRMTSETHENFHEVRIFFKRTV